MTNEEIIKGVRNGNLNILKLWAKIKPLIEAKTKTRLININKMYLYEDVLQESFIQLLDMVQEYDERRGMNVLSYFINYYYPRAYNMAIYSGRSERIKNDPLINSVSIYTPINEEGETLINLLLDENAENYLYLQSDYDFWEYVGTIIRKGARELPELQQEIILTMLNYDMTLAQAQKILRADETERNKYSAAYRNAKKFLKQYITSYVTKNKNKTGIEYAINMRAFGLKGFKSHGFSSYTERLAIEYAERDLQTRKLNKIIK